MTAESISDLVEQAVEWTVMKNVPVEDRSRLVSDVGGKLSRAFKVAALGGLRVTTLAEAPRRTITCRLMLRDLETDRRCVTQTA